MDRVYNSGAVSVESKRKRASDERAKHLENRIVENKNKKRTSIPRGKTNVSNFETTNKSMRESETIQQDFNSRV